MAGANLQRLFSPYAYGVLSDWTMRTTFVCVLLFGVSVGFGPHHNRGSGLEKLMSEHDVEKVVRSGQNKSNSLAPCDSFFLFLERFFGVMATPGGRLMLTLLLTVAFYGAMFFGVDKAVWPGSACLLNLLKLARNPRNTPT